MRQREDSPEILSLIEDGWDALEEDDASAALVRADEALRKSERSASALHLRAEALLSAGHTAEGIEAYERALEHGGDDVYVLLGAADLFVNRLSDEERDREDLDRGRELARSAAKLARKKRDEALQAEAALVEGASLTQLGRPDEALPLLDLAARSLPDSTEVEFERGTALYELCRFEEAREALLRAETADADHAWVQYQLGLVEERRGDEKAAKHRFDRARKLAPDDFPKPIALSRATFDAAVEEALAELPDSIRRRLGNVAITVEDLPALYDLRAADPPLSPASLGMFRGPSYGQGGAIGPGTPLPPSIVLFQRNLERFARNRAELREEIRVTLVHEVGHFLGLDEDELYERGLD